MTYKQYIDFLVSSPYFERLGNDIEEVLLKSIATTAPDKPESREMLYQELLGTRRVMGKIKSLAKTRHLEE